MGSSGGGAFLPNDPPPSTNQAITTPTALFTAADLTATGATGATATALSTNTPAFYTLTGASGAGSLLPVAVPGAAYVLDNLTATGAILIYAPTGNTVNGVSGTTGTPLTATGTHAAIVFCAAAGAWKVIFNT